MEEYIVVSNPGSSKEDFYPHVYYMAGILAVYVIFVIRYAEEKHRLLGLWFLLAYLFIFIPLPIYLFGWIDIDNIPNDYFSVMPIMTLIGAILLPILSVYKDQDREKIVGNLLVGLSASIFIVFTLLEEELIMAMAFLFGFTLVWNIAMIFRGKITRNDIAVLYFPLLVVGLALWLTLIIFQVV